LGIKRLMKTLKAFASGDGAHCGLTDWYPNKEAALRRALKARLPFDTGWYGSKKEIASARISSVDGKTVDVEVSVSDDFDTCGNGCAIASPVGGPNSTEQVADAIYRAWDDAEENRRANQPYAGYRLVKHDKDHTQCLDYYLVDRSGEYLDGPPGDYYHHWGWQEDPNDEGDAAGTKCNPDFKVPSATVQKFEEFAQSLSPGSIRIGKWELVAWEDDK
jgi:hypothetical protein